MKQTIKNMLKTIRAIVFRRGFGCGKWKSAFCRFGEHSEIQYPAIVTGREKISIGNHVTVLPHARLENYEGRGTAVDGISIGDGSYICSHFSALNAGKITIGKDVLIASYVLVSSENHGVDPESEIPYMDQPLVTKPVEIKDGCWIGEKVCILPGVTIGEKCIIGAGSVVTKSIPDHSIAVGNPARVIQQYDFNLHQWVNV